MRSHLLARKQACDAKATAVLAAAAGGGASRGAGDAGAGDGADGDASYPDTHWLERWWETLAYHSDRNPLPINVNVFGTMYQGQTNPNPCRVLAHVTVG